MKEVTCFQANNGSLHKTEISAAVSDLTDLSKPDGTGTTSPINKDQARALIKKPWQCGRHLASARRS